MNYPMQSYGLGGLNTVQNMSDRNVAETLMANGGQRFAGGGISNIQRMAAGGIPRYTYDPITGKYTPVDAATAAVTGDSVPKYTYDPITQRYTLDTSTEKKKEEGVADSGSGGGGSDIVDGNTFSSRSPAERAAYYAENPNMGAVTRGLQGIFGLTSLGMAQNYFDPSIQTNSRLETLGINPAAYQNARDNFRSTELDYANAVQAQAVAEAQYANSGLNAMSGRQESQMNAGPDFGGVAQSGHSSSFDGSTVSDTGNTPGGGGAESEARGGLNLNGKYYPPKYAQGGLPALAQGGMSNLGDYSDGGRLLRGPGDGVSDSIPATIANKRPARLADGEFVVPARIVSELGNGSTEAGARKLYQMLARVQNARKKSIGQGRVAVNSRAEKLLPA